MDYLTSGNECIKEGASLIAWGAFLTSLGWVMLGFLLGRYGNLWMSKVKFFQKTAVHIIIVIMLIAGIFTFIIIGIKKVGKGGTLTTKGWKQLDNASQKRALIAALARECLWNEMHTHYSPMTFDANDPNLGKEHLIYPQFRTSAQDNILTSALFDLNNQKDTDLLIAIFFYEESTRNFNMVLDWTNENMNRFPENVMQQKRKETYLGIRDIAPTHKDFNKCHEELLKLLKEEYGLELKEAMYFFNKKFQKELGEKYKWLSEEQLEQK